MKTRAHIFISGKVQGVFFRQTTRRQAENLDVKGWIRNLPDGRVEAVFEGEEESVKSIVEFCKHGPSRAKVENVELKWEDSINEFHNFKTR